MKPLTFPILAALAAAWFALQPAAHAAKPAPKRAVHGDAARLVEAERDPANWMMYGRTYSEQRYSPLGQVNDRNVGTLGLAWHARLDIDHGTEATPVVVDGVMYTTGARSIVYAFDARTGRRLWKYDPQVPAAALGKGCCDIVNRGVAIWEGKVYVGTYDGRLVALSARDGKKLWEVVTVDRKQPYTVTAAPRVIKGRVIIGNGGSEFGVRGYVSAYDARTGKQAWRFYTVPDAKSAKAGDATMKKAAATWPGAIPWNFGGGGNVWEAISYDPELNLLYIGVGNASPWNRYLRNPGAGDNLFLTSIVALNADTGRYVWHYQATPNEGWDYDSAQQMILADLSIDGAPRKALMQANKNAYFYVLDRKTGELISAAPFSKLNWATGVDMKTGRPIESPDADYGKEPKLVWPGAMGAHNWQSMAFHPGTGLVYIPEQEAPWVYIADPNAKYDPRVWNTALGIPPAPEDPKSTAEFVSLFNGSLLAWDPVRRKAAWKVPYKSPGNGGVLATGGNLVFHATADGRLIAYSADKGEKLWETFAQTGLIAAPMTYRIDGEQYVAIMAGWGGSFARTFGPVAAQNRVHTVSRVLVYKLGGKETLPPLPPGPAMSTPPPLEASAAVVARGSTLYDMYCVYCHGIAAVGGGSTPDLRHMSLTTREQFMGIVVGGLKEANGMPRFLGLVSIEDAAALNAYLVKRAHDELKEQAAAPK
jgi:quinohemoprotein ethanol dehydrogenase